MGISQIQKLFFQSQSERACRDSETHIGAVRAAVDVRRRAQRAAMGDNVNSACGCGVEPAGQVVCRLSTVMSDFDDVDAVCCFFVNTKNIALQSRAHSTPACIAVYPGRGSECRLRSGALPLPGM